MEFDKNILNSTKPFGDQNIAEFIGQLKSRFEFIFSFSILR